MLIKKKRVSAEHAKPVHALLRKRQYVLHSPH